MIISKDFKFDCAHMLSNYTGKCAKLHGHTYHGTVSIEGEIVNDESRMLLDYNDIKKIIDMFDHAIIFSSPAAMNEAEHALLKWASKYDMRVYCMPFDYPKTTAEDMVHVIARTIYHQKPEGTEWRVKVSLSETDGSWAYAEVTNGTV